MRSIDEVVADMKSMGVDPISIKREIKELEECINSYLKSEREKVS